MIWLVFLISLAQTQLVFASEVGYILEGTTTYSKPQDLNPKFIMGEPGSSYILVTTKSDLGPDGKSSALITKIHESGKVAWEKEVSLGKYTTPSTGLSVKDGYLILGRYSNDKNIETPKRVFICKLSESGKNIFTKPLKTTAYIYTSVQASDGNILIGGIFSDSGYAGCSYVAKVSRKGELLWEETYFCSKGENGVSSVETTSTGDYIALGYNESGILLFGINEKGKLTWEKQYKNGPNTGVRLIKEGKEFLALAASDVSGQQQPEMYLFRVNETGDKVSEKSIKLVSVVTDIGHIPFKRTADGYLIGYTVREPSRFVLLDLDNALNVTSTNIWKNIDRVSDFHFLGKNRLSVIGLTYQNAAEPVTILNLKKSEGK